LCVFNKIIKVFIITPIDSYDRKVITHNSIIPSGYF